MEFQVVLMAGGDGTRMAPLTNQIPKVLLPIGNVPMVVYCLKMLEKAKFSEVIVIAKESTCKSLDTIFEEYHINTSADSIKTDIVSIPNDSDMGTADALRFVKNKIHTDFIVMSADMITDVTLDRLVDLHRRHGATVTTMLAQEQKDGKKVEKVPDKKGQAITKGMTDFIVIEPDTSRLILFENQADLPVEDELSFSPAVVQAHPITNIYTDLLDAHVYIFAKWTIEILKLHQGISSIKGELIPYIVRKQFSSLKNKDGEPSELKKIIPMNSFALHKRENPILCYAYVVPVGGVGNALCVRANTTQLYHDANRKVAGCVPKLLAIDAASLPLVDPLFEKPDKLQMGGDCMVGVGSKVDTNCTFKRTIIGKHCVIGAKVQISDSIIMNHVTIGDGCIVKNSIICNDTYIGQSCNITFCQVDAKYSMEDGTSEKNKILEDEREL
eukprot:m.96373 g.96373  ORF g.96373 m.96373 type:complete len:442 (+) comp26890_c0_seq1:113-1438(+)